MVLTIVNLDTVNSLVVNGTTIAPSSSFDVSSANAKAYCQDARLYCAVAAGTAAIQLVYNASPATQYSGDMARQFIENVANGSTVIPAT